MVDFVISSGCLHNRLSLIVAGVHSPAAPLLGVFDMQTIPMTSTCVKAGWTTFHPHSL